MVKNVVLHVRILSDLVSIYRLPTFIVGMSGVKVSRLLVRLSLLLVRFSLLLAKLSLLLVRSSLLRLMSSLLRVIFRCRPPFPENN